MSPWLRLFFVRLCLAAAGVCKRVAARPQMSGLFTVMVTARRAESTSDDVLKSEDTNCCRLSTWRKSQQSSDDCEQRPVQNCRQSGDFFNH